MSRINPDDRSDNASKIKRAMRDTQENIEASKEMMAETDHPMIKADLKAKNERRAKALQTMEHELKQEIAFQKNEGRG